MNQHDKNAVTEYLFNCIKNLYEQNARTNIDTVSPYSQIINQYIRTAKELQLYIELHLSEGYVTRPSLLYSITANYKDVNGVTNLSRMLNGKAPIDAITGTVIRIHHIGQKYDSPFAEIPNSVHHGSATFSILHDTHIESWRINQQLVRKTAQEIKEYWRLRGEMCRNEL